MLLGLSSAEDNHPIVNGIIIFFYVSALLLYLFCISNSELAKMVEFSFVSELRCSSLTFLNLFLKLQNNSVLLGACISPMEQKKIEFYFHLRNSFLRENYSIILKDYG